MCKATASLRASRSATTNDCDTPNRINEKDTDAYSNGDGSNDGTAVLLVVAAVVAVLLLELVVMTLLVVAVVAEG